ncbi:discoidin domain-containing protein [Aestuariivivens insulae]|uniref:discoidin domain-containing protein n=1 Tax=Aestuariivivens insulae TaxID=1621988 RepID=UPI001F578C42|nr:discoidin domain-containing protein [Aestuariivivens insulae]
MRSIKIIVLLLLAIMFGVYSCEEKTPLYEQLTDSKEGTNIFLAKSNKGIEKLTIFPADEETRITTVGAGYGGLGIPANNIDVTLGIDTHVLDSINETRVVNGKTPYELFPEEAYVFDKMNLTIPAGELYSDLSTLTYYPEKFDMEKGYLLPISISDASGYPFNRLSKTLVFLAPKGPRLEIAQNMYDTTGWEVIDFSSDEPYEANWSAYEQTGSARAVIDGILDSFWHTCWAGCTAEEVTVYPHWLTIDMKEVKSLDGIRFHQRQSNTRAVKDLEILISTDNQTWVSLGDYQLEKKIAAQDIDFESTQEARYFKVLAKTAWDGTNFAAMAEITPYVVEETYVFDDED